MITTSAPYCLVDFHTDRELYTARGSFSPSSEIQTVSVQKRLNDVAGTWSVELVGHDWYHRLKPMDLVVIQMGKPPERMGTVMVGLIDDVRRTRTLDQNGTPIRRTTVRGRDFGKVLLKAVIKWFPQFSEKEFPISQLGDAGSVLQMLTFYTKTEYQIGTATNLIRNTLTNILHVLMSFQVKYWRNNAVHNAGLQELLGFRLGRATNIIPFQTTMSTFEGSLWNYMTAVQNKPFHELYLDTLANPTEALPSAQSTSAGQGRFRATFGADNSQPVLIFRPTPFDKAAWDRLKTHTVTDQQVINEDLGRSDHENYNMFMAKPSLSVLEEDYGKVVKPVFNSANMRRHGIAYMEVPVEGIGEGETLQDNEIRMGRQLSETLRRWFQHNVDYESGSLTLVGNEKIRIGERLRYNGMTYYIEGVSQQFTMFGTWRTHVSVTRGQK